MSIFQELYLIGIKVTNEYIWMVKVQFCHITFFDAQGKDSIPWYSFQMLQSPLLTQESLQSG